MMFRRLAAIASIVTALGAAIPAHAADSYVTWAPGSLYLNPSPSVAVVSPGSKLTYANLDIARHDVVALPGYDANGACTTGCGSDSNWWCGPLDPTKPFDPENNPRRFALGQCPLFWSFQIPVGGITPVEGAGTLVPGSVYTFYCTLHQWMTGRLVVSPA